MANGHGGHRTPSDPAPVSGPGATSRRTDGQGAKYVSGLPYGEGQDYMDLQSSAPMAQAASPTPNTRQGSAAASGAQLPTPFGAPTERPNEPVTAGNPMGAGPGPEALSVPAEGDMGAVIDADRQVIAQHLPALMKMAGSENAPAGFRMFVRHLRNLG